ncbi:MAG: peroxiredoxin family protein [Dehalococcoidia bacterium]|nr:peroxiredoxin family protein [Dehalococcoidia bacterium]
MNPSHVVGDKLIEGSALPGLSLALTGGGRLHLPAYLPGRFVVLRFYRGDWCTLCRRHLSHYQANLGTLDALGIVPIAASVDDAARAGQTVADLSLTFPVGYGLTHEAVAAFGPWWGDDERGRYIQPAEFLIGADGVVIASMYGSGAIGRMPVEGVLFAVEARERRRLGQTQTHP